MILNCGCVAHGNEIHVYCDSHCSASLLEKRFLKTEIDSLKEKLKVADKLISDITMLYHDASGDWPEGIDYKEALKKIRGEE